MQAHFNLLVGMKIWDSSNFIVFIFFVCERDIRLSTSSNFIRFLSNLHFKWIHSHSFKAHSREKHILQTNYKAT